MNKSCKGNHKAEVKREIRGSIWTTFLYTYSTVTQVPSGTLLDLIDHYLHIVLKSNELRSRLNDLLTFCTVK